MTIVYKLLVGPHSRIVGRVALNGKVKPPTGHKFIPDDPIAKIGQRVKNGKLVPEGRKYTAEIRDANGDIVNIIIVEGGNEPALADGETLQEVANG